MDPLAITVPSFSRHAAVRASLDSGPAARTRESISPAAMIFGIRLGVAYIEVCFSAGVFVDRFVLLPVDA